MSKKRSEATVFGHFGFGKILLNGQTAKTKIVTEELERYFGKDEIVKTDTHGGKKALLKLPIKVIHALKHSDNIIMLPAQNGVRILSPLLTLLNKFFHRKLHYVVIGGWLPSFLENYPKLIRNLKKFNGIFVETETMRKALNKMGFENVYVMPNCKKLQILKEDELVYSTNKPFKVCTFSRVMKEKGIEDAVNAVKAINEKYDEVIFSLDIYGTVDENQTEWFESLTASFPSYISYNGSVSFDKSTECIRNYHALLFPTYYEGEGFAGTLIDAMAAGVPVIASDWKYNVEIVKNNKTGVIYSVGSKECFINKLSYCFENFEEWNKMKLFCIEEAGNYTPEKVVSALIKEL